MTSLSSLPASFSAEKRCKGKHFFSFHQNFFQVFFGEVFRGGRTAARKIPPEVGERCQPFIVQRLSLPKAGAKVRTLSDSATHSTHLPKAGAKVRTLSDSATHSTHFFSSFFDVRGKYAVKQGFTTETFWKGSREEGKTAHLYIRAYAITFIYAAQTRANFYPKGRKFLFGA